LMELLILELGMGSQPFLVNYTCHGSWVMATWLQSVWENVWLFGIHIEEEGKLNLAPPCTGDEWLMPMFLCLGFNDAELLRLNRVQIHQQVLYYSDVMDARGTMVDKKYLTQRMHSENLSRFRFPMQQPPNKDFRLWERALLQLRHTCHTLPLGVYVSEGHKVWDWRYVEEENIVLHMHDGIMDIHSPSEVLWYANRPIFWTRSRVDQPVRCQGSICTMDSVALGVRKVSSSSPAFQPDPPPTSLEAVFREWGCTWLCDDLQWRGDTDWLCPAI
jgi:hypothetical protein